MVPAENPLVKFFGDETGTDKKPSTRISAIGGLFGREQLWDGFDKAWKKVLEKQKIPFFHAVQCERGTGEFYGLDVAKRGDLINRLLEVLLSSHLQPCAYGVVIPYFNEMSVEFRSHYTSGHPDVPYFLCLHHAFVAAGHAADGLRRDEQVHFMFEKQDEFEADARASFDELKKSERWPNHCRLGRCDFAEREDYDRYPGLQAADLLAYEMYRHLDNRHFQGNLRPEWKVRTTFRALQRKMRTSEKVYGGAVLAGYFDRDTLQGLEKERLDPKYYR